MANTLLTPTQVTREALRVLHQKLNFVGSINRQYDEQYAKSGAKIGIRNVGAFRCEMIPQLFKKPKTSFTCTLFSQTPERVLYQRRSPAKIE